ncbi:MAG: UDP-N-acetylglucosamine 4,6-dehydratase family protein [Clostridia bacterium]
MSYYANKKILIIGGTGTIGNRMVSELLKYNPTVIRILSRDEFKQFEMQTEYGKNEKLRFLIGDVRDSDRVERAMQGIDIVFNLAAMKHVLACEYNPTEAIKTNVTGMENVINSAIKNNVECVIFTSTDKAINPINSYGATKLLAERLVQAANYSKGNVRTKFIAVRFGNVMGSRGSVIPLFKKQVLNNKQVTITNGDMTRFMMTLSEAVELTLGSVESSVGGEVFVLKMPVIRLKELAEVIVEECCKKYGLDMSQIIFSTIGLRPGEKMFEELMTEEESLYAYDLDNMYAIIPPNLDTDLFRKLYKDTCKVKIGKYSSGSIEPINKEVLRELVIREKLI